MPTPDGGIPTTDAESCLYGSRNANTMRGETLYGDFSQVVCLTLDKSSCAQSMVFVEDVEMKILWPMDFP